MKLKVYTMISESFRYGDSEGEKIWRYSNKKLRDEEFEKEIQAMRKITDLTEYEPNSFEDSIHKWAYDFKKRDEIIEIHEREEGEFLNQLIIEQRKDKIKNLKRNEENIL